VLVGIALAALGRASASWPWLVEWHRNTGLPVLSAFLQAVFGAGETSRGEAAVVLLVALLLVLLFRRPRAGLPYLAIATGLVAFLFYATWGLAYRYSPLTTRFSPSGDISRPSVTELVQFAEQSARLVARAASASIDFSGPDDEFLRRIDRGVEAGFVRVPLELDASPIRQVAFGQTRPSRVSFALSRLQLSGYYFPWTGEAHINAQMPRTQWPRTVGHEKAHQRGHARENDATVMGVLACLKSSDPTVFYGGALGLFAAFDREVARVDRAARRGVWALLPARAVQDFEAESAFWRLREGVAAEVSERVNDTYLKAQGVQSGVASYGETTILFLQAIRNPRLQLAELLTPASPPRPEPE